MANENPSPEDIKAYDRAIKGLGPEMQKQIEKARALGVSFEALVGFAESFADQLEHSAEYLSEQREDLAKSLKQYQGIDKVFKDHLKDHEKVNETIQNNLKIQRDFGNLLSDETQVLDDLLLKRNMIGTGLKDEYAQLLTTYMLENDIKDLGDDRVKELIKELKHRQHVKENLDDQLEITEALAGYTVEVREEAEKLRKEYTLLGGKIKAVLFDPEVRNAFAKGLFLEKSREQIKEMTESFDEFRKEGLSVSTAFAETGVAFDAMFSLSGASLKENTELMAGIAESTGNLESATSDAVAEVGKLSKTFGIAAGDAGKLYGQMKNLPGASEQSATETMRFAGNLAKAAHVAPGAVMKDMAQNSEAIAANTKNGGKDMVAVSVAAHKLGIEMSTITKMSEGLLDFENSINKQMEASVLLGREINLDKAREAALNGDLLGATQEMLKNVGGEAEFNKMNVVQRKALAESMGVSVGELSKMVKNQDKLASLTKEQQEALATNETTIDDILANSGGMVKNYYDGITGLGGQLVALNEMRKALKDTLGMTKSMVNGFKEGSGFLGKMKGLFGFGAKAPIGPQPMQGPLPGLGGGPKVPPGADKAGMLDKLAKIDAKQMLSTAAAIAAVGAALMLIGLGIKFASEGLAELVQSFKGLSNDEMNAALIAITLVIVGFAGMLALMIPIISAMGAASTAVAGPLMALGLAFLLIGVGIAAAAFGIGYMVKQFGEIPYENLMALPVAMLGIGAGLYMMGAAGAIAIPTILALLALGAMAPRLAGLASSLGGLFGGGEGGKSEKQSTVELSANSIDQIASKISAAITSIKGDVILDKEKVGVVLSPIIEKNITLGSTPVRKGGK